jgi:hypothetical protein
MSSSKKITCKVTLLQEFISLQNPIRPTPYLFTQGRGEGGRVEPEKRLERHEFTKLGRKFQYD